MRLIKARVQNYRSVKDTGLFDIENLKTILVGPNEAGKTVVLQALQNINKPQDVPGFEALRDYPRSLYNDISVGKIEPKEIKVVTGIFQLETEDKEEIPERFHDCQYKMSRYMDNKGYHELLNAPPKITYGDVKKDLLRLGKHLDSQTSQTETEGENTLPSSTLADIAESWTDARILGATDIDKLKKWLTANYASIEEDNENEEKRYAKLEVKIEENLQHTKVLEKLSELMPVFILFNNYFRVKPSIHLEHLAKRSEGGILDDEQYDYGNLCLLKLLGFTARELAELGNTASPAHTDAAGLKKYKDQLDERKYQLNAASVKLTKEIQSVWVPDSKRPEADKLRVSADGQYLKVVVEDALGVEIELDQRSAGFQWLVSFFVVFFAESMDKHENAILLLDEPGLSLHGLKQREFRKTISRLSDKNQTIYTTHSPFLVGPNELDLVRVVEMKNREEGTKVHTTVSSSDPAGLLPLQEALGYDLAHSLFSQQRNLILEGITDYWYIEAVSELLRESKIETIDSRIALVFADSAGKVVYYATILHAHNLKVSALLDSDAAGEQAAKQEHLVHSLGNKNILRTQDFCDGVPKSEIEDLLRETLPKIVHAEYGVDISKMVKEQSKRPIVDICAAEVKEFSKYKLAKAFVRWSRENKAKNLNKNELDMWKKLFEHVNKSLK
ncbi:AAA family ATPase [Candidatus Dojkabacteria bacterium]|nr:AAA family ATPase [Candidatus Dojkabacteria bacterium]